jgi:hypothetical protein
MAKIHENGFNSGKSFQEGVIKNHAKQTGK